MIEGLRQLPWLQERIRNERQTVEHLLDCTTCMQHQRVEIRQAMGCGYEPRSADARPWQHHGDDGPPPTTCPGYTTRLPEVNEIASARFCAKNGLLTAFSSEPVTEPVLAGIQILEGADGAATAWAMKPKDQR